MNEINEFPENYELIDGYWMDRATGEIIEAEAPNPEFRIDCKEHMDWYLEKRLNAVAEVNAIEMSSAVLAAKAVLDNATRMATRAQKRVDALDRRFSAEATEFARQNLPTKGKTYYSPFGEVAFRAVPSKLTVADEAKAILWAQKNGFQDCVKSTFQVSKVPKWKVSDLGPQEGFEIVWARESVSIKTDIKA